jgi:urea transport system substrate-binding protein
MPTTSACPGREVLADLLANALPAAEAEKVRQHLAACPDCLRRLMAPSSPATVGQSCAPVNLVDTAVTDFPFLDPPRQPGELGWLAGYRVLGLLGAGGMGYVFEAEDPSLNRRVALKVLKPKLASDALRQRFLQEARLAAKLPHDHIAAVFQVGQVEVSGQGQVPFLAMERLHGESLESRLRQERWLPLDEALRITREAAEGLAVAHAQGLVHRDIKPPNLWLEARPAGSGASAARSRVKIIDFGLARPLAAAPGTGLTVEGTVVGTPCYMAPEQALGKTVDERTDLYGLGCVLYRMLGGAAPFEEEASGSTLMPLLAAVAHKQPRPLTELAPQTPGPVVELVNQLLARDPAKRPASAGALVERLRALEDTPTTAVPVSPSQLVPAPRHRKVGLGVWVGAGMVLLAALFGLYIGYHKLFGTAPGPGGRAAGPGPSGEEEAIVVGILYSLTGQFALNERPIIDATQLAVDEINEAGGVMGRPLLAVTEDGASDPEVFAAKARKLLREDGAAVLFGCYTSACRKRVAAVCTEDNGLLLYPSSYEGLEEFRSVFYIGGAPNQVLLPTARWAYAELGKRRFFLVGLESVYSRASHAILSDELKRLGATVAGEAYAPVGDTDFAGVVRQITEARPDMILNTVDGQSTLYLFQALRKAGIKPDTLPTVWFNVSEHELHYLNAKQMIGDYSAASYFMSVDTPANRAFIKRFQDRFGPTRSVNDNMQTAYHAVYLWKQAAEKADKTDTDAVREALRGQQIEAPEGLLRIDGANHHTWRMARVGRVVSGQQFKVVWTSPETLEPHPIPPSRTRAQWQEFLDDLYRRWGGHWEKLAQQ